MLGKNICSQVIRRSLSLDIQERHCPNTQLQGALAKPRNTTWLHPL